MITKNTAAPLLSFRDVLRFGKYKGKTVANVLVNDYRYLHWLYTKGIKCFDKRVMVKINESLEFDEHCYKTSRAQGCYSGKDAYEQCAGWL